MKISKWPGWMQDIMVSLYPVEEIEITEEDIIHELDIEEDEWEENTLVIRNQSMKELVYG